LRTIETLKRELDVRLITGGRADLARLKAYHGTELRPGELTIDELRLPLGLHRTPRMIQRRTKTCRLIL
jgi:hypothetical protein